MKKKIISSTTAPKRGSAQDHADRVAEQMKENLKKRKAQARAQGRAAIKTIKEI